MNQRIILIVWDWEHQSSFSLNFSSNTDESAIDTTFNAKLKELESITLNTFFTSNKDKLIIPLAIDLVHVTNLATKKSYAQKIHQSIMAKLHETYGQKLEVLFLIHGNKTGLHHHINASQNIGAELRHEKFSGGRIDAIYGTLLAGSTREFTHEAFESAGVIREEMFDQVWNYFFLKTVYRLKQLREAFANLVFEDSTPALQASVFSLIQKYQQQIDFRQEGKKGGYQDDKKKEVDRLLSLEIEKFIDSIDDQGTPEYDFRTCNDIYEVLNDDHEQFDANHLTQLLMDWYRSPDSADMPAIYRQFEYLTQSINHK